MLVLSRRKSEGLRIGDEILIEIVEVRGDKVRIGIECPATIPVHRQEILDAIQLENERGRLLNESRREHGLHRMPTSSSSTPSGADDGQPDQEVQARFLVAEKKDHNGKLIEKQALTQPEIIKRGKDSPGSDS